jgi:hypothetical protein
MQFWLVEHCDRSQALTGGRSPRGTLEDDALILVDSSEWLIQT